MPSVILHNAPTMKGAFLTLVRSVAQGVDQRRATSRHIKTKSSTKADNIAGLVSSGMTAPSQYSAAGRANRCKMVATCCKWYLAGEGIVAEVIQMQL